MAQNALIQVRVDEILKQDADALFSDLGLDTPTAIRIFLKQSLKHHGLPFDVTQLTPNAETVAAMKEADILANDSMAKRYANFSELVAEVENEI